MALLHADVCIIGNELSGFVAGALLAQRGHRVVLIDYAPAYETKLLGDYFAPTFPHIWQMPKSGPVAHVFDTLELRTELKRSLEPKATMAFIHDPHERIITDPDKQKFNAELYRAFGEYGSKISWSLTQFDAASRDPLYIEASFLNESSLWGTLKAKKRIAKSLYAATISGNTRLAKPLLKQPLADFLSALLPFVQYQASLPLESIGGHLALKAFQNGNCSPVFEHTSSYSILKSIFAESFLRHGGEILQNQTILKIETRKKQITQIHLNGPNNYMPDTVIDAGYAKDLSQFMTDTSLSIMLKTHESLVSLVGQTTICRWLLPRSLIPKPMPTLAASLFFEKEQESKSILGIFNPWKHPSLHQSNETLPESHLALVVMATWSAEADDKKNIEFLKISAERLLPFAYSKRLAEDTITKEEANWIWPQFTAQGKGLNRLSGRPLYTPLSNLLRAARDVAPALGIDGEIAVAEAVSKAVKTLLDKKDRILLGKRT